MPAMRLGIRLAICQRHFVITLNANDLRAIGLHRSLTCLADMLMDINLGVASRQLCTPGDRSSMIAIGRSGHRYLASINAAFHLLADQISHRIGTAECLEGTKAKPC